MLLFAYLMKRTKPWADATIRVLTKGTGSSVEIEKEALSQVFEDVRIEAKAIIVSSFEPEIVVETSQDAAMVFLPFTLKANQLTDATGQSFDLSLPRLPVCALVLAAQDIDLDSEPEEVPAATDALEAAKKKAVKAEKQADNARETLAALSQKLTHLEDGVSGSIPLEKHKELKKKLDTAEAEAKKADRHAAKAKVKAEDVAKTAEEVIDETISKKP